MEVYLPLLFLKFHSLTASRIARQRRTGRAEHGHNHMRVLEHLQRREVQAAVAPAQQPVDRGVVVVGVEVPRAESASPVDPSP
jgi:hypothetical protein